MRTNFKQVSNLLQEGVDADGGYLVPEEYDKRIIDALMEDNIMRGLGTIITTSGQFNDLELAERMLPKLFCSFLRS